MIAKVAFTFFYNEHGAVENPDEEELFAKVMAEIGVASTEVLISHIGYELSAGHLINADQFYLLETQETEVTLYLFSNHIDFNGYKQRLIPL
ncbi:hypothetical protein [Paenibacillus sp. MMO-177]|uniref:hypothetical protein n=1 Tax=Paenibacillus sp. MMO-177 TaxID=3081289 RepID=UPI0030162311